MFTSKVELDKEYFIRVYRLASSFPGVLEAMLSVDGNILSLSVSYRTRETRPVYFGLIATGNGIETNTSLNFTKRISLVHADTKFPFKEHTKDGKIYVEVEPDEEYFICIQRVGNAVPGTLVAYFSVDGKSLGFNQTFTKIGEPRYAGLWTYKDNTSTHTALMFTKPR